MNNVIYPNGTSCIEINGTVYDLGKAQTQVACNLGVDFVILESFEDKSSLPRGINKRFSCCRITGPDGQQNIVINMKKWVEQNFTETYGWVMMNLKTRAGYKGYHAEKLFSVCVTASQISPYSAIPLGQPKEYPWMEVDQFSALDEDDPPRELDED